MENQSLRERVKSTRETAMRNSDKTTRAALDAVWVEVEKAEKTGKRPAGKEALDNDEMLTVIARVNKQYGESLGFVEEAEEKETDPEAKMERKKQGLLIRMYQNTLAGFLPQQMNREEIRAALVTIKVAISIDNTKQIGQLMGAFNKQYPKKADNVLVKEIATELLS